jgi:CHAT domain-containing protein
MVTRGSARAAAQPVSQPPYEAVQESTNITFLQQKAERSERGWVKQRIVFQSVDMKEVIGELANSIGVKVEFDPSVRSRKISFGYGHITIAQALHQIFRENHLTFKLKDEDTIIIALESPPNPDWQTTIQEEKPNPSVQDPGELVPGVPIARALVGGEVHTYRVTLAGGQYLRIVVDQGDIDVVATVFGPTGQPLVQVDSQNGWFGPEPVSVVAETSGEYRIELLAYSQLPAPGRYEVRIEELREATQADKNRFAAQQGLSEGNQLLWQDTAESLPAAMAKYEDALGRWRGADDPAGEAETLQKIGSAHRRLGNISRALEYYLHALRLWRTVGNRVGEAHMLYSIGAVYDELDEKQQALDYLNQALVLRRAIGYRRGEADALINIGKIYFALNEPEKALDYYHQALWLKQAVGDLPGEADVLTDIAGVYLDRGETQNALEFYDQALRLHRTTGDRRGEPRALYHLGWIHFCLGEMQKALDYYQQSLDKWRIMGDRRWQAMALHGIGLIYADWGNHDQALHWFRQALLLSREVGYRSHEAITLAAIARVERDRNHLLEARTQMEAALGLIESLRTTVASPELRSTYMASVQRYYEFYTDLLMRLDQRQPSEGHDAAALQASERARARSLLELLTETRTDVQQGVDPELKHRERATQARISAIQNQLIQVHSQASPDKSKIAQLEEELKQVEGEREQLEMEIRQKHPRYAELQYPQPLDLKAIQGLLDDQTALLEYAVGKESSFLFVVSQEGVHSFRLSPEGEINQLVQEVRAVLRQPSRQLSRYRDYLTYVRAARQLYEMLMAPAADVLATKQNLLIAPDGALYYLPFEVLLSKDAKRGGRPDYRGLAYMLKQWAISYVPSASVLASLRQNRPKPEGPQVAAALKALLAFGDPVYESRPQTSDLRRQTKKPKTNNRGLGTRDKGQETHSVVQTLRGLFSDNSRWELHPLPETRREITGIRRLHKPDEAAVYLGASAKEENVKDNEHLSTARRIHFATHGVMSERLPQYSGLVLTLDDDPQEDGLLQVYEIFNLKLNADLVVLSACETGLGKEVKGEGIIGLTRAFLYAGTPSVVVSLWQVADHSTAGMMVKFYEELDRAVDKAEGLRRAKLGLMQTQRYAHPFYWAPFILVGERK